MTYQTLQAIAADRPEDAELQSLIRQHAEAMAGADFVESGLIEFQVLEHVGGRRAGDGGGFVVPAGGSADWRCHHETGD